MPETRSLPVIDVGALVRGGPSQAVARAIGDACRAHGFFYVEGHGVDEKLEERLDSEARAFFARPESEKADIAMSRGGRAWRGWFPVGGELTSGKPDLKEGIYFGTELGRDDPRVRAGVPLHGANLFPANSALREVVLAWMEAMTRLGHALMRGVSLSLGLDENTFHSRWTRDPLTLFRIFHYPPDPSPELARWGVGEHTDYGLLTILKQDACGGLEVKANGEWLDAPPIPGTFVCNIGDMLERLTGGRYLSTPHRVRNVSGRERLSFPFFFDPAWDAEMRALELPHLPPPRVAPIRWDKASVHDFEGPYGQYLLRKVGRVFPELKDAVL